MRYFKEVYPKVNLKNSINKKESNKPIIPFFSNIKRKEIKIDGIIFYITLNTNKPQEFKVKTQGLTKLKFEFITANDRRVESFRQANQTNENYFPLNSMGLLVSHTNHLIKTLDNVDYDKMSLTYNGIKITRILDELLINNDDVNLVIIGNHRIITLNKKPFLEENSSTPVEDVLTNEEFHKRFTKIRAETIKNHFFQSNKILALSRWEVIGNSYNGIPLQEKRNDPVGITIGFDFSKVDFERSVHPRFL